MLIPFNLYSDYLTKEALEGFGDFKITGQVIYTVKYAYDFVLLAKEKAVLQGMTEKLIEIVRWLWNGNELEKTIVMRVSRQSLPIQIMIDQKLLGNGDYFNYLGSMITSEAEVDGKINPGFPWNLQLSTRRRRLFSPANWTYI